MPLWKIHNPSMLTLPADKKEFAGAITAVLRRRPHSAVLCRRPFEEVRDSFYVGAMLTAASSGSRSTDGPDPAGRSSGNGGQEPRQVIAPGQGRGYDWSSPSPSRRSTCGRCRVRSRAVRVMAEKSLDQ